MAAGAVFPSPSWPLELSPQQKTAPDLLTAHACEVPAAMASASNPEAVTGVPALAAAPLPPWLFTFAPQQVAAPVARELVEAARDLGLIAAGTETDAHH